MKLSGKCNFEDEDEFEPGLTEDQKIEKLIKKYQPYLTMTDMDICHSLKGKWYFFRYSEKHDSYEIFTQFETATELIEIVIGELCMDATFLVEESYNMKPHIHPDLVDFMNQPVSYQETVMELKKYIKTLAELSSKTY